MVLEVTMTKKITK